MTRCRAFLSITDDLGINRRTFGCELPDGHSGRHLHLSMVESLNRTILQRQNFEVRWGDAYIPRRDVPRPPTPLQAEEDE